MAFKQLCDDKIAEFLINTEQKESKITQNILLNRCYLLFEEYVQEQNLFYILKLCRRT